MHDNLETSIIISRPDSNSTLLQLLFLKILPSYQTIIPFAITGFRLIITDLTVAASLAFIACDNIQLEKLLISIKK